MIRTPTGVILLAPGNGNHEPPVWENYSCAQNLRLHLVSTGWRGQSLALNTRLPFERGHACSHSWLSHLLWELCLKISA